jgi:hypothetical protein
MNYKMNDVLVGDEVIFDSSRIQSNHDLYWKVIGTRNDEVMIQIKEMGFDENWTLKIEEVKHILPTSDARRTLNQEGL